MPELRKAKVLVQGKLAGFLIENDEGYCFYYDEDYVEKGGPAVSITLPISKGNVPYQSKTLFPFFDGLIPEGWLLDIVVHNWKLSPDDRFGLLLVACKDCIGDVSVVEEVAQ